MTWTAFSIHIVLGFESDRDFSQGGFSLGEEADWERRHTESVVPAMGPESSQRSQRASEALVSQADPAG